MTAEKVAIIPARGGSKRIPGKNIKEFCGKPIITWSIETAMASGLFDKIVVSTDSEKIADVATSCGAEVPFMRPAELSGDFVGITEVIVHSLEWFKNKGIHPSLVCCICATAPFLETGDLARGLECLLGNKRWAFVFSASSYKHPVQRAFSMNSQGGLEMLYPDTYSIRTQDLPEIYHDVGQFYWGRAESWLENQVVFGDTSTIIPVPAWRALDIDNMEDWKHAEIMWHVLNTSKNEKRDSC